MIARSALLALLLLFTGCGHALPQPEPSANETALHDPRRVIALEGGRNFRDFGGYRTFGGQRVKWGVLYRSGSPEHLTEADMRKLDSLGIRMVCDLRSTSERERSPNRWAEQRSLPYWSRDYTLDMAGVIAALDAKDATPAQTREAMIADYRAMPEVHAQSLTAVFRNLAEGRVPLAVNCSAGKDRTGLTSAIVLASLGVPMMTVIEDYALSDKVVDYRAELLKDAPTNAMSAKLAKMPWDVVRPLLASDPAYIEAAFGAIEQKYGSLDVYLEKRLGVTSQMRAAMRARLLEKA
jgi:protein-tyrosine phosphatase